MSRVELAENLRIKQAANDLANDAKTHGVSVLIVVRNHDANSSTFISNGPFDHLKYLLAMAVVQVVKMLPVDRRRVFCEEFAKDVTVLPEKLAP